MLRRLLSVVSVLTGLLVILVLYVLRGPFQPYMETTRRLHRGVGRPVPEIVFRRLPDGAPARLADLEGRVVVVILWATWCPPCVHGRPARRGLEDSRGAAGLVVAALSDEPFDDVRVFAQRYPLPAISGTAEGFPWLPLAGFRPYSLVIDRRGILRGSVFGTREAAEVEGMVRPWV